MSALPPKADMCSATSDVGYGPAADIACANRKTASRRLRSLFDHAAAWAFRFLRQPSRPNTPRPVAKSGSAPGNGTTGVPSEVTDQVPALRSLRAKSEDVAVQFTPAKMHSIMSPRSKLVGTGGGRLKVSI